MELRASKKRIRNVSSMCCFGPSFSSNCPSCQFLELRSQVPGNETRMSNLCFVISGEGGQSCSHHATPYHDALRRLICGKRAFGHCHRCRFQQGKCCCREDSWNLKNKMLFSMRSPMQTASATASKNANRIFIFGAPLSLFRRTSVIGSGLSATKAMRRGGGVHHEQGGVHSFCQI